jgi:S-formylglutathione hydrolase FrmB
MLLRGSVFSKVLEMETGLTIVGPSKFETGEYQVVYLLHGQCGRSGDWAEYTMLPTYANDYNILFIMPEVARSFYTDMKYGQHFFSYVADELPKVCKSVFNISAKREDTAVIGASMGGYGALKCALSKPEVYGYAAAFSAPCLFLKEGLDKQRKEGHTKEFRAMYGERIINDFEAIFGTELVWTPGNEILALAQKVNGEKIKPKIYTACGTEDFFYYDNVRFRDEMEKLDFTFTYEEWTGIHDWYFFNEALRKALHFYFGQPDTLKHRLIVE